MSPAASASACNCRRILSHVPSVENGLCRFHTVCQGPNSDGRSRHARPERSRSAIPSILLGPGLEVRRRRSRASPSLLRLPLVRPLPTAVLVAPGTSRVCRTRRSSSVWSTSPPLSWPRSRTQPACAPPACLASCPLAAASSRHVRSRLPPRGRSAGRDPPAPLRGPVPPRPSRRGSRVRVEAVRREEYRWIEHTRVRHDVREDPERARAGPDPRRRSRRQLAR